MAFQFVPNADGGFNEGDRQTNPETGVEYIFTDGAWRPLGPAIEDEYDKLDERYLNSDQNDEMNGRLTFNNEVRFAPNDSGTSRIRLMQTEAESGNTFQFTSHPRAGGALSASKVHIEIKRETEEVGETILRFIPEPVVDHMAAPKSYVDNAIAGIDLGDVDLDGYLPITGGELTGKLEFNRNSNKPHSQFTISPNSSSDDFATNIYSLGGGQMRFRTSPAGLESTYNTHIILDWNDGTPTTKIYDLAEPTHDDDPTTRKWVEQYLADNYVDLDSAQTITATKTFGSVHNSSTNAVNLKGKVQVNSSTGDLGQVLTSGGTSKAVQWANVVANSSVNAGTNGCFYEANNALYYRTY